MKKRRWHSRFIFLLLSFGFINLQAQMPGAKIGSFDFFSDIGAPEVAGKASYSEPSQSYLLTGSGSNIWFGKDSFSFLSKKMNGDFDIYKISKDGGKEIRLTDAKGLDDGSEYSPDGKYIYFCSTRTGTMQVWRMDPDGKNQVQLTFDTLNNWFPHVSPDNKWIVFITFPKEVPADSHPFYQRVYLRLMPIAGGEVKVIGYLYGGQGTINVPGWSPDSKKIALVSNGNFN